MHVSFITNGVLCSAIFFLILMSFCDCEKNNVCKTYEDYSNMTENIHCYYNPNVDATPEELAYKYGFDFERHSVETEDNYVLTLFRINSKSAPQNPQPIFIHHGLLTSAKMFMIAGENALAFTLAKKGYDVWLANHRGNPYSSGHKFLKTTDPKFWDFSFHEIGVYDIPASLEYVTEKTGNFSKIIYMGHSMGTTASLIYSSVKKNHAEQYVKAMVYICPVASLKYSNIPQALQFIMINVLRQLKNAGGVVVIPQTKQFRDRIVKRFCGKDMKGCAIAILILMGPSNGELIPELVPLLLSVIPVRTSLKCFEHFSQFLTAPVFNQFDYGLRKNLELYNSTTPPKYKLSDINVPIHLFYGLNDILAPERAVNEIYRQLSVKKKSMTAVTTKANIKYNHLDFILGKHVHKYFHKPLFKLLYTL